MKSHFSLAVLSGLSMFSAMVFAQQERYETAMNTGESPTGDYMLNNCHYETIGGYTFSIIVRGVCPAIVRINPETGDVKRP